LLDVLPEIDVSGLLTVIVPRHPQRFDQVAALLAQQGITFQRRSANEAIRSDTTVILGDSMGEMFAYYAASDLAFIGGSLLPFGGQNLIEAAAVGTPVLIGPHTYNFEEAAQLAVDAGAAARVADADALAAEASSLLKDRSRLAQMSLAGKAFSERHRGATLRTMALVERYLKQKA
jgi:3-deoxy-D-manno-octulosonic-acid transferase